MSAKDFIDVAFDFRTDSLGRDPDLHSPTLRRYHKILWSKPLPSGQTLYLEEDEHEYLIASNSSTRLRLTSDTITNSMSAHKALAPILDQIDPLLVSKLKCMGSTIGARLVFPGEEVAGRKTLNVLRGFHPKIRDRFDLTLECIKRHFEKRESPLSSVLARYKQFFSLFESFEQYVDFFLLQDLILDSRVDFFTDAENVFEKSPYPATASEYEIYAIRTINFVTKRNVRIQNWASRAL